MSCYAYCHHIRANGSRTLLNHDKNTIPGRTFYYCSIHRVYHCIQQKSYQYRRRLQQPLCGECAWLFFRFPGEAEKRPASDLPTSDLSAVADVAVPRTQDLSASTQDEIYQAGGSSSRGSQCSIGGVCESDDSSLSGFEAALDDINRYIGRSWTLSSPTASRSPDTSDSGTSEKRSPDRASTVVAGQDQDGDVVMSDPSLGRESGAGAGAGSERGSEPEAELETEGERTAPASSSATTTTTGPTVVRVPIRSRRSALEFIPYEDPSVFHVRPVAFHAKYPELFMFRYTDFAGRPAVQPTSARDTIQLYLAPLDTPPSPLHSPSLCTTTTTTNTREQQQQKEEEDEVAAVVGDSLLRHARWWSCWAQGFEYLEPELRWVLTLVFDFANVMVARQALGGYGPESPVFWRARHILHDLLGVAEDLTDLFGIPYLQVPRLDWFAES